MELEEITIKFTNPDLDSLKCNKRDDFTGFDAQPLTPYEFLEQMRPYIDGTNFDVPLLKEI
jgi:hypothetical protein